MILPFERLIRDMYHVSRERSQWKFVEEAKAFMKKNKRDILLANKVHEWMQTNGFTITREDKSKKLVLL